VAHELRETSGLTSRLLLTYADRQGGRRAVEGILDHAGCNGREPELMDERTWFSLQTKIRLFEAAAAVLDDPVVTRNAGVHALELSVGDGLKVALRALGSPRLVYQHIVRASNKFSAIHTMELVELTRDRTAIAFADTAGYDVHRLDCEYNKGLLSVVPALFGMAPARVSHPTCAAAGDERCVYELSWDQAAVTPRSIVGASALAAAAIGGTAVADPALLPVAGAASLIGAVVLGVRARRDRRLRWRQLEEELRDKDENARRFTASLQDLVSELDLGEVLDKIVLNAHAAVAGKNFVLLVDEDGALRWRASTGVPEESMAAIGQWAAHAAAGRAEPVLVEDVTTAAPLAGLLDHPTLPVGSICSAPLVYRGLTLGHLVALAPQSRTFLPRDVDLVRSYAVQAAVALANARHFAAQRALATRDPLTGLLNHREFHEGVHRELERCRRHGGEMGVALFDLDGFKLVNDGAGHAEGDRVLRGVAAALQEACRGSDLAFRIGGDEFALLLPETGSAEAAAVAERVRDAIGRVDGRVSTSVGLAAWPHDGGSKDVLLAHADALLYAMKGADRRRRTPLRDAGTPSEHRAASGALLRERLAVASRLSARLAPMLEEDRIIEAAVGELHHSFDYKIASITARDGDALRVRAVDGTLTESHGVPLWSQPLDRGISARVVRTGATALVHDTTLDPDHLDAGDADPTAGVKLLSQLAVPLKVAGRVWGVLSIEDTERQAFTTDDVLLVETVGAQVAAALHRAELFAELDSAFATTLGVLCDAVEAKDASGAHHAHDVAELAHEVAGALGVGGEQLRAVRYGALLHDLGKIGVRTEILTKPGPLTPAERTEMERHATIGAQMLETIPFFATIHPIVRASHERWDGGGYPEGLAGEDIPLGARIVAVCDALHAMTADRPYRAAMPVADALAELERCAGGQFDPRVVQAVVAAHGRPDAGRAAEAAR
jgi:diguanylate cyclase (GGDEF)-like protein/putative nucleotidyltransferase with HDIG domain